MKNQKHSHSLHAFTGLHANTHKPGQGTQVKGGLKQFGSVQKKLAEADGDLCDLHQITGD